MAATTETTETSNDISESVRFYISPHGSGRINTKHELTEAIKKEFPIGKDLHATFNRHNRVLTIKEM